MKNIEVKVYRNFNDASCIKEEWNNLLSKSVHPNIFLTWEWIHVWWKWFGKNRDLFLIVASDDSGLIGILPAYASNDSIMPGIKFTKISLIGDGGLVCPEYLGPIVLESNVNYVVDLMLNKLLSVVDNWSVLKISDVLMESKNSSSLVEAVKKQYVTYVSNGECCYYHPLPTDYEDYLNELSAKRRKKVRQNLRRAGRKHKIHMECYKNETSVDEVFSIIYDLYKKSARGINTIGGWPKTDYRGFHIDVAKAFAKIGCLRIYVLFVDNIAASYLYCYQYDGVLSAYQTSTDLKYNKLSAGSIIFQLVIEDAIKSGVREFDYLRGAESYKSHYSKNKRSPESHIAFSHNGIAFLSYKSKLFISKTIQSMKSIVKRAMD